MTAKETAEIKALIEKIARAMCYVDGRDPDHESLTVEGRKRWEDYWMEARPIAIAIYATRT